MALKDYFETDLDVIINQDEFGSIHIIDGVEMQIVLDSETLKKRKAKQEYGYEGDILFHVKKSVFGETPAIRAVINFDGEKYRVTDVQEDEGMYTITLEANMS